MTARREGSAQTVFLVLVGLVVAAAVVVGVMYFTSDVYRTKIQSAADQYAHWTPENIAKDPENYLKFCEEQANKALLDLKASEISIAQNRGKLESMLQDSTSKITVGEKALTELKDLYTKTDSANSWPTEWQGQKRDKDWMKRQIVSLSKQVEGQKSIKSKVQDAIKKLDLQVTRVQTARSQTQEQIAEVKTSREILKVQRITNELTDRLINIKSVLQATISTASESTGTISLDQLTTEAGAVVDEGEFDKIMGKDAKAN
jgi:predicted  nucleic acid-binding Zn-ribbon protein